MMRETTEGHVSLCSCHYGLAGGEIDAGAEPVDDGGQEVFDEDRFQRTVLIRAAGIRGLEEVIGVRQRDDGHIGVAGCFQRGLQGDRVLFGVHLHILRAEERQHRHGGLGRHHAGQMRGTTGPGDDGLQAAPGRPFRKRKHVVGHAMRRYHPSVISNLKFVEHGSGVGESFPVAGGAHDD